MAIKRGPTGHSHRYVPEGKINTLYGDGIRQLRCRCCGEVKNQSEYYHAKGGKPLTICIKCDDARRLRDAKIKRRRDKGIHVDKNLQEIPNLFEL